MTIDEALQDGRGTWFTGHPQGYWFLGGDGQGWFVYKSEFCDRCIIRSNGGELAHVKARGLVPGRSVSILNGPPQDLMNMLPHLVVREGL